VSDTQKPVTQDELRAAVQAAVASKTPLELVGTATKRGWGRPMQTAQSLDLSGFSAIELYEPEELVLTVGPGALRSDVDRLLDEKNQYFAFEPPDFSALFGSAHAGTLGGMLACNLAGPRRIKTGAARDHILGIAGVSGRGEVFKAGGRVVKNVTGYDVPKLMAGSFGTLAALTTLTFKVLPRPETEETLVIEGLSDEAAIRTMSLAMQSSCEVSGAAHVPGQTPKTLLRLDGMPGSIVYRRDKLAALLQGRGAIHTLDAAASRAQWISIRDVHPLAGMRDRNIWRISVTPSQGDAVTARIARSGEAQWFYDWAGGLIWLAAPPASTNMIRSAVSNGHATLVRRAPGAEQADAFHPQPAALAALSQRVKHAFDPLGIFNPGRMSQGY
jgi:glycolate oxidase FAD binding subunit